ALGRWLLRRERVAQAAGFLLAHGVVRALAALLGLASFLSHLWANDLGPGWADVLVFTWGFCVLHLWAGWRATQKHPAGLVVGWLRAFVSLPPRLPFAATFLPLGDEQARTEPLALLNLYGLYVFVNAVQLVVCSLGLAAYVRHRRTFWQPR